MMGPVPVDAPGIRRQTFGVRGAQEPEQVPLRQVPGPVQMRMGVEDPFRQERLQALYQRQVPFGETDELLLGVLPLLSVWASVG